MYEQGDIVIVFFPFSDLSNIKQRPVLILSKDSDNKISEDIITCGITSNLKDRKYSILINNENLENGKIPVKSRIKIDKLFTVRKQIIRKKIAKLNSLTFSRVREKFHDLL